MKGDEAESALEQGDFDRAVAALRAQLAGSPGDPMLRARLAEAYRLAGNQDRAFHHFDQAARSLAAMGRDGLAADLWTRADELVPGEPEILFRLARALESSTDRDRRTTVLERLKQASTAPGDRRHAYALEQLAELDPPAARLPEGAREWARLAAAHHEAGRAQQRDHAILQLLRAAPSDPEPLRIAAGLLAASGRHAEAESLRRRIGDLAPLPAAEPMPARYGRGLGVGSRVADTLEDPVEKTWDDGGPLLDELLDTASDAEVGRTPASRAREAGFGDDDG